MGDLTPKNWLDELVERASLPQVARKESVEEWCKVRDITPQAYYYQLSKPEIQKQVLELSLNKAKNELPDILDSLIANAKKGKEKSVEMYLDYIIKLAKNLDIKSDGKPIIQLTSEVAQRYAVTPSSEDNSKG